MLREILVIVYGVLVACTAQDDQALSSNLCPIAGKWQSSVRGMLSILCNGDLSNVGTLSGNFVDYDGQKYILTGQYNKLVANGNYYLSAVATGEGTKWEIGMIGIFKAGGKTIEGSSQISTTSTGALLNIPYDTTFTKV